MNKQLEEYLLKHCKDCGHDQDESGIYEMLSDEIPLHAQKYCSREHWDEYRYTVAIGERFIGYIDEGLTGNMVGKLGFEFDPNTICEMEPVERTIVEYVIAEGDTKVVSETRDEDGSILSAEIEMTVPDGFGNLDG